MLYVIGLGPGKEELMSQEALEAIKDCEIIVGYSTYMRLIKDLVKDKEMVATGMLELLEENDTLEVKVVPGITASLGAAAVMGAPLMNDFCHISLSDLMTPWEMIEKRLHAAAQGDFVVCLYNPRSKGRPEHLARALEIMSEYKAKDTIVGIGKDIGRKEEQIVLTTIEDLDETLVDMTTIVIVGNKETYVKNGRMITPRGYTL